MLHIYSASCGLKKAAWIVFKEVLIIDRRNNNNRSSSSHLFVLQITKKFKARLDERSFTKLKKDLLTLRKFYIYNASLLFMLEK